MSRIVKYIKNVDQVVRDNGLAPTVRKILVLLSVSHLTIGVAALGWPHLYASGAYEWVTDLMPWWGRETAIRAWGVVFLSSAALSALAVWRNNSHVARIGITLYVFVQCMFAASILKLTFEGFAGAFAGSIQWMLSPAITIVIISSSIAHPIFKKDD